MKKFGYAMITFGFLAGALVAVLDQSKVRWDLFLATLGVGIAGLALIHLAKRGKTRLKGRLVSNMQNIETSLSQIVENVAQLNREKHSVNTYEVRHRIDEFFPENLAAFVEARESIAEIHGLHAYADIMSYFAAGERYLNRVWSASADGYVDEVNTYLDKAHAQFVETLHRIGQLKEGPILQ